jgi:hypothetical protein
VLFHAFLDSEPNGKNVQSYRGFRANWTGTPSEEPAIIALSPTTEHANTTIYVSWNGDTETTAWRFYTESRTVTGTQRIPLGEAERKTFETKFVIDNKTTRTLVAGSRILAEAVDKHGKTLVASQAVTVKKETVRPHATFPAHRSWFQYPMRTDLK